MPSAVTRSQLRAPAWRPAGGAAPAQPQSRTPARTYLAVPHAASPHFLHSQADSGVSDVDGGGPHTASPACLIAGTGTSPPVLMPEVSTARIGKLPCTSTRALCDREETPFFTPEAALLKSNVLSPCDSSSAGIGRSDAASLCHNGSLPAGTPHALAHRQALEETLCQASSIAQLMPELTPAPTSWGGSSVAIKSSREGSGAHGDTEEQSGCIGSDSTGSCKAGHDVAGSAHSCSSNAGSWDTDMAEWGSSGPHLQSPDTAWSPVSDHAVLQQTPLRQRAPEQSLLSAPSSVGECVTPDMASCDQPPLAGDSSRRQARMTLHSPASSCQAAVIGAWIGEQIQAEGSHASFRASQSPAEDSVQSPSPVQPAQLPCSADSARSSSARPASPEHVPLVVLHGSCLSASAGSWASDSRFWEAPAGALPGQATQSPLPCQPGMNTMPMSSAASKACPQAQGPQHLPGEQAHLCIKRPNNRLLCLTSSDRHTHRQECSAAPECCPAHRSAELQC